MCLNNLTFLVDTGASISIIKKKYYPFVVENKEIIKIKGISGSMNSLGSSTYTLKLGELSIKKIFHIIPDNFEIPFAGFFRSNFWRE